MADEAVTLRDINWRETFPFTHLFRAFRIAVQPSKLILALLAIGCLWCGGLVGDAIWGRWYTVAPGEGPQQVLTSSLYETPKMSNADREYLIRNHPESFRGIFRSFWDYEVMQANDVLMFNWSKSANNRDLSEQRDLTQPSQGAAGGPTEAVWNFVATGPLWLWSRHWLYALLYTTWFLLVWSIFGGAISRIAAVHVARDEKISVRHALSFSAGKILSFIFAPVIPVLIIMGIGVAIAGAATALLHIPWAGPIIVGLFFFLALLGGFIITLVMLGAIGGFNLMYPTIAVEGSDSFDAISRSFSYVFARPWRMLWYTVVAIIYGAICYLFVRFFIWVMLSATWFFMHWFLGGQPATYWPVIWPPPTDPLHTLPYSPDYEHLKGTEAVSAGLIVWWVYLVIGLIGAFAISFYFSANTIIYCLMRREVDATEMDDVYIEETEDELEDPAPGEEPPGAPRAANEVGAPVSGTPGGASAGGGTTTIVTGVTTVRIEETPATGTPPPSSPAASEPPPPIPAPDSGPPPAQPSDAAPPPNEPPPPSL